MDQADNRMYTPYSYQEAGFNAFFMRSIASNPAAVALNTQQPPTTGQPNTINYDNTQAAGAMGDTFMVGQHVRIDGSSGRISTLDDGGNETSRLGDLGD